MINIESRIIDIGIVPSDNDNACALFDRSMVASTPGCLLASSTF